MKTVMISVALIWLIFANLYAQGDIPENAIPLNISESSICENSISGNFSNRFPISGENDCSLTLANDYEVWFLIEFNESGEYQIEHGGNSPDLKMVFLEGVPGNLVTDWFTCAYTGVAYTGEITAGTKLYISLSTKNPQDTYNICAFRLGTLSNEQVSNSKISLFPNPVTDVLNFKSQIIIKEILITSLSGKKVYQNEYSYSPNSIKLDHLGRGLYFITLVDTDGKQITKKFIRH